MKHPWAAFVAVFGLPVLISTGCQHRGSSSERAMESAGHEAKEEYGAVEDKGQTARGSAKQQAEEAEKDAEEQGYDTHQEWHDTYEDDAQGY